MKHFIWFLAHLANPISSEPISVGFLKFYNFCWKGTVDLEFPDSRQLEKWFIIAGHYEVYKIQMSHYLAFKPLILPLLYVNSEYNEINWTIMFKVILLELVPLFQFVKKNEKLSLVEFSKNSFLLVIHIETTITFLLPRLVAKIFLFIFSRIHHLTIIKIWYFPFFFKYDNKLKKLENKATMRTKKSRF